MPVGLLTGLGAALSWGTLDLFSALASRRVGSLWVTTGMQIVGALLLAIIALVSGTRLPTDPYVLIAGALVGLAGAGAYLMYFTGLRIGPIAVVSGVVAAYGGLTVVLAVLVRGESLTPIQALGAAAATLGVVLTGISFAHGRPERFSSPGVIFAVVALVLFAAMSIGSDIVIDRAPWLQVLLVTRLSNAFLSIVILVLATRLFRRQASAAHRGRRRHRRPRVRGATRGRSGRHLGRARHRRADVVRLRARARARRGWSVSPRRSARP